MKHTQQDGFTVIFFVMITTTMIIAGIVGSLALRVHFRERILAYTHGYQASAMARSCASKAFFWSKITPNYAANLTCSVEIKGRDFYVKEEI